MASQTKRIPRIELLDCLRGLAAFGVMIFHFSSWTYGNFEANAFLGRVGLYAVSLFYILSGLTLFHVYFDNMKPTISDLKAFFLKRVFRIFPLLWLVQILTIILLMDTIPQLSTMVLNFTGLFGIFRWDDYLGTGVWSIGNELVFYLFFPLFIFLSKRRPRLFYFLGMVIMGVTFYLSFYSLTASETLTSQWSIYINPLNQLYLFLSGYLLGYLFERATLSAAATLSIFFFSVAGFILYPVQGDASNLVTGKERLIFSTFCILLCFSVYKHQQRSSSPNVMAKLLKVLGESSYSIYLLHPIVWYLSSFGFSVYRISPGSPDLVRLVCAIIASLVISWFCYNHFEKYFMEMGKQVAKKTSKPDPSLSNLESGKN